MQLISIHGWAFSPVNQMSFFFFFLVELPTFLTAGLFKFARFWSTGCERTHLQLHEPKWNALTDHFLGLICKCIHGSVCSAWWGPNQQREVWRSHGWLGHQDSATTCSLILKNKQLYTVLCLISWSVQGKNKIHLQCKSSRPLSSRRGQN